MKNQGALNTQVKFGFADQGGAKPEPVGDSECNSVCHAALGSNAHHAGGEDEMTEPSPTSPGNPRSSA